MEVVFNGKEVKVFIERKIEQYEKTIETYHEKLEYEQQLLTAAKQVYNEKGFWFKLTNTEPTLDAIRGLKDSYDKLYYAYPETEIEKLNKKVEKLEKLKNSLEDNSQVILNEDDLLYYKIKE